MLAAFAARISPNDPLSALDVGERPEPEVPAGWVKVAVKAASINHHDLWSLRGVGLPETALPMILGCDASGVTDDGREVLVHSVISSPQWTGDETLDPRRSLLSERHQGTFAESVVVPAVNLVDKPGQLSFEEASCLPTAWLTAYRMLFTKANVVPGQTVLVQGAGGSVASALITLGVAAGLEVWVTSRDQDRRERAVSELGAHQAFEPGARLPKRVDAVMETVGEATWSHSLKSLRPGGTVVVCGATTGAMPGADLQRVFFLQLNVVGSTMGTRHELQNLVNFCVVHGLRPHIDQVLPLSQAREGLAEVLGGNVFGKVVLQP